MKPNQKIQFLAATVSLLSVGFAVGSGTNSYPWLGDCSMELRETYDNNVFLSGATVPSGYVVPAGSVAALKDRSSWVTTVAPVVGINFIPLLGGQTNISLLSLKYAPEFNLYHDEQSESYDAHHMVADFGVGVGQFSLAASDSFTFINGNRIGPFYPGNLYSAFGTTADRERREQIQDRANVSVQFDMGDFFVRPTASLLYYNLMTDLRDIPGYQNYSDRYDVNGGFDLGYRVIKPLALTIGYRYGYQFQQQYSFSPYSAPNDYQRLLVGIEGNPLPWLQVKFVGGPDFHSYEKDSAGHITPLNDLSPVKYYGEGSLTADLTKKSELVFKYKTWQWVAGIGKVPFYEQIYDFSYQQHLLGKLTFNLGGRITAWDFSNSNIPGVGRHDQEYTANAGVDYAINRHFSMGLNYSLNLGRNAQNGVVTPQNREFDDQMVSVSSRLKF